MKKVILAVAFSMQSAMALHAQPDSFNEGLGYNYKRTLGRSELRINAVRDFTNRFGDVPDTKWSSNEDFLRAKFTRNDILHMVDYDKKGRWVSTIRVYNENNMSSELRKIVKSNYIDYLIVKVIEVKIGKRHVHFIKLENHSSLLTLHIMDGEITETENYRKG